MKHLSYELCNLLERHGFRQDITRLYWVHEKEKSYGNWEGLVRPTGSDGFAYVTDSNSGVIRNYACPNLEELLIWIQNFVFPLMIDSLSPFFSMFDIYESEGSIELKKHISKNLAS